MPRSSSRRGRGRLVANKAYRDAGRVPIDPFDQLVLPSLRTSGEGPLLLFLALRHDKLISGHASSNEAQVKGKQLEHEHHGWCYQHAEDDEYDAIG